MATRTTVSLVDDLDGTEASETIPFDLDRTPYEIDLSADNAVTLRKTVADYIAHARRVSKATTSTSRRRAPRRQAGAVTQAQSPAPAPKQQAVVNDPHRNGASGMHPEERKHARQWARQHGFNVGTRGRIPAEVLESYRVHHLAGPGQSTRR